MRRLKGERPLFSLKTCFDALHSPRHAGGNRLIRNRLSILRGYRLGKFPPACRGLCRVIPVLFYRENSEQRRGRPLFLRNYFRPIYDPVSFPTATGNPWISFRFLRRYLRTNSTSDRSSQNDGELISPSINPPKAVFISCWSAIS